MLTEINMHSKDSKIEKMTASQAIEILQKQIDMSGETWGARKHFAKAMDLGVKALTEKMEDSQMDKKFPIFIAKRSELQLIDFSESNDGVYSIHHAIQTIVAETTKQYDNLIFSEIFNFLPPEVTDVVVIDKQYIVAAIREKMEREEIRNV